MRIRLKNMPGKVLEGILVLALVLVAFLGILYTLNSVFPTGLKMRNLILPGGRWATLDRGQQPSREFRLYTGGDDFGMGDRAAAAAILTDMKNEVKIKRRDQVAWHNASRGMRFKASDAIQTLDSSSATVLFKKGNFLKLGENSLIALRSLQRDVFTRENRMTVVLMNGQLTGRIGKADRGSVNLEVLAPGIIARAPSRDSAEEPTAFTIHVAPDSSSRLVVEEGTLDLTVGDRTVTIPENQVVRVLPDRSLVYLRPPPRPPAPASPPGDTVFRYRNVPPEVVFTWSGDENTEKYHFVLASDPLFERIVYDGTIAEALFSHGNLKPGTYFWRVSGVNRDGEGAFSAARRFELVQDLDLPVLEVFYPLSGEKGDRFTLKGRTDPDAKVFVSGLPVKVDEKGAFTHDLFLQRGFNVIVVEAVDKVGNVNYFSRTVNVDL